MDQRDDMDLNQMRGRLIKAASELIERKGREATVEEIAAIAVEVNATTEEIGARRLHTVMERVLDALSFDASELGESTFVVTADYVRGQLRDIVKNQDLSRYIL